MPVLKKEYRANKTIQNVTLFTQLGNSDLKKVNQLPQNDNLIA